MRWYNLAAEPAQALREGEDMGFKRVIVYVTAPFPLGEITSLAELLNETAS